MRRRRHGGFGLLEILVALMVFSAMAALVYGMVRMGSRSWEVAQARIDQADAMRIGWGFVQDALANSRPEPARIPDVPGIHFFGGPQGVEFVADMPAYLGTGGLHVVSLQLRPDPEAAGLELVLRRVPLVDDGDATAAAGMDRLRVQEAVLAEHVADLEIRYYGPPPEEEGEAAVIGETEAEPARWQLAWRERDTLPVLVRIDVALEDGGRWPVLVAHPRLGPPTAVAAAAPRGAGDATEGRGAARTPRAGTAAQSTGSAKGTGGRRHVEAD